MTAWEIIFLGWAVLATAAAIYFCQQWKKERRLNVIIQTVKEAARMISAHKNSPENKILALAPLFAVAAVGLLVWKFRHKIKLLLETTKK